MSKNALKIRPAADADIPVVGRLWREMVLLHGELDPLFTLTEDALQHFADFVHRQIEDPQSVLLVAERDGEVVGYCLAARATYPPVFRTQEYGMIYDMAVSAERRREGVGEKLYGEVLRWFEERGIRRIELRVVPTNKLSTSFWKKQGFRPFLETLYREI